MNFQLPNQPKQSRRHKANQAQLRAKFSEQEGRCFYCECLTWLWEVEQPKHVNPTGTQQAIPPAERNRQATREHLVRRIDGGNDSDENIVMACLECNSNRHDHTAEEWLDIKQKEAEKNFESDTLKLGNHGIPNLD